METPRPGQEPAGGIRPAGGRMPSKWLALLTVATGTFMAVLDANMVNVSLPTITAALRTDLPTIQWVVMSYLLTITCLLIPVGRLADMWGRQPFYSAGFVIFGLGAALCGSAQSAGQLILFRIVQGIGAAMLMAIGPAIIAAAFPSQQRGQALGLNVVVVATTSTIGPTLGGLIIDLIDWRAVFYLRVPIGVAGLALALWALGGGRPAAAQSFDFGGAVTLAVALGSLLLALGQRPDAAGALGTGPLLMLVAALAFASFFLIEGRVRQPLIELSLFRHRLFAAANLSSLLSFMAIFAVGFLMPFYLQRVLGYPPREVGLVMMAQPLVIAVVAPLSGWLSDRMGSRFLCSLGLALVCLGLASLSRLGVDAGRGEVVARLALIGLGQGLFQSPNNNAIMSAVPKGRLGLASSMLATMRNLGMVLGVAISGGVFSRRLISYSLELGGANPAAFVAALSDAFLVAAAIASIGILAALVRGKHTPSC